MKKIFYVLTSVLLCAVVLSLSIIPSFAIVAPNGGNLLFNYAVINYNNYSSSSPGQQIGYVTNINPDDATEDTYYMVGSGEYAGGNYSGALARIDVTSSTNTVLFEAGYDYSYTFNGIIYSNNADSFNVARVDYYFRYSDGTSTADYIQAPNSSVTFEGLFAESARESFKVSFNFSPEKDVTRVWVRVFFRLNTGPNNRASYSMGYGNPYIDITKQGNNNSILGTIRDWLSGIYNYLTTSLANIISEIGDFNVNVMSSLNSFKDSVVDFIQSVVSGKIIEDLHTLLSGSLEKLPSLNSFTQAVTDYITEEANLLNIFTEYENYVDNFFNELDIGTEDIPFGIGKGLLVASACVTYISTEIPLINELLYFGLAVGIVGFVIGSSWLVGKFISTHQEEKNFTMKMKF